MRTLTAPFWIDPQSNNQDFPNVELALIDPNGLLAVGGDLHPNRLLRAYRSGIFPWYTKDQPILWWSPNPRSVLFPQKLKVSRSFRKTIKKKAFQITLDTSFHEVIQACANSPRTGQAGTWITDDMIQAYKHLHKAGFAHSAEAWFNGELAGGLYGVAVGKVFFGESMFSKRTDASKIAFYYLVRQLQRWGFMLIDCQVQSEHLDSLGAESIPRPSFIQMLNQFCSADLNLTQAWALDANPTSSHSID